MILDFVKCRIEAFNRQQGGGVTVSKDDTGYILTGEDTGVPIAKLRRKGKRGEFQVLYWNRETAALADGQPVRRLGLLARRSP